jgi:hypothetical protein
MPIAIARHRLTIIHRANAIASGIDFPPDQSVLGLQMENNQNTHIGLWESTERLGPQRHLRECGVQAPGGTAPCRPPAAACNPHAQKPLAAHLLPS